MGIVFGGNAPAKKQNSVEAPFVSYLDCFKIFESVHDVHIHPDGTVEVFNMKDGTLGTYQVDELHLANTDIFTYTEDGYDVISVGFRDAPVRLGLLKVLRGIGLYGVRGYVK